MATVSMSQTDEERLPAIAQYRHHRPYRRGQDHDDRAYPVLHRQDLPHGQRGRGYDRHRLDGAGAGARHHHSRRPPSPASGRATRSTSSTRPATSTSPPRCSAACACSTAASSCSTRWRASSRSRRRSGGRPTATACRASASSTRWTAPAPTFWRTIEMIQDASGRQPAAGSAAHRLGRPLRGHGRPDRRARRGPSPMTWARRRRTARCPPSLSDEVEALREQMVERIAETDDDLTREVPRRRGDHRGRAAGCPAQGHVLPASLCPCCAAPRCAPRASSCCSTP